MASAVSAATTPGVNGDDATFFCLGTPAPPSPIIVAILDIPHSSTVAGAQIGCDAIAVAAGHPAGSFGAVEVTGPIGANGAQGPTGPAGGTGGTGGTGSVGNTGLKGAQGATGPQGGTGGPGGVGSNGAQGATGAVGPSPTGITGGPGGSGDTGLIGPQGPSGAQGPTGPTATVLPPNFLLGQGTQSGGSPQIIQAGVGQLGNTLTFPGGNSQIKLHCPSPLANIVGGGAEILPGNATVRGILESSFPNTTISAHEWIVTAEVTAVGTTSFAADNSNQITIVPWVVCR